MFSLSRILVNYTYSYYIFILNLNLHKDPYHPLTTLTEMTGDSFIVVASSRSR